MKRITLSLVVALALIVSSLIGLRAALRLPLRTAVTGIGGPGTFPVAFLVIIIALSAILAVTELIKCFSASEPPESESIKIKDMMRVLLMIAAVTIYMWNFRAVSFIYSTPLLTLTLLWLFGYRNKIVSPVLAIGFTFVLHSLFQTFLRVPLP